MVKNMSLGDRLKEERVRLGYSQPKFAELVGASKRTQIGWEQGRSSPPGDALSIWANEGMDVTFVVTGEKREVEIDRNRVRVATEAVLEALDEAGRRLPPKAIAELILAAYELIEDTPESKENIVRLVRMVA